MPLSGLTKAIYDVQVRLSLDNKAFMGALAKTEKRVKKMGKSLTMGLTLPLIGLATATVNASLKMNKGMANVASLIPQATERVVELKKEVQALSIQMGQSTSEMTEGLYQIISAFGDNAETMQRLEINARLAAAGLSTVTEAISVTSAVTKGYGDTSAEAMEKVADLAMLTVKLGQTTFPELASSIGRVVPLGAALGVEVEELFAGFATLTGVTGNASEVSTQLAAMLRGMIKPTGDMASAIKELGYESALAMISELGLVESFRAVIDTTDGSQEALGTLLPRAEALTAVFALIGGQADVFDEKMKQMADSTGALGGAFDAQKKGINKVGFEWDKFKARLTVTSERIGDQLIPVLGDFLQNIVTPLLEKVTEWVLAFTELDAQTQKVILVAIGLAAALGPVLIGLSSLISVVTSAVVLFSGPAGWIALILAAVAAIVMLTIKSKALSKSMVDTTNEVKLQTAELNQFKQKSGEVTGKIEDLTEANDDTAESFIEVRDEVISLMRKFPDLQTELGYTTDDSGNLYDANGDLIDSYDTLQKVVNSFSFEAIKQSLKETTLTTYKELMKQADAWKKWYVIFQKDPGEIKDLENLYDLYAAKSTELAEQMRASAGDPGEFWREQATENAKLWVLANLKEAKALDPLQSWEFWASGGKRGREGKLNIEQFMVGALKDAGLWETAKAFQGAAGLGGDGDGDGGRDGDGDGGDPTGKPGDPLYVRTGDTSETKRTLGALHPEGEYPDIAYWMKEGPMKPMSASDFIDLLPALYGFPPVDDVDDVLGKVVADVKEGEPTVDEDVKDTFSSLEQALIAGAGSLAKSAMSGGINNALASAFDAVGAAIAAHVATRIGAQIGGLGGGILGAVVGAGIGALFSSFGSRGRGETEYTPVYAHITNWDDYYKFGFTLPSSFVMSGRVDAFDVDPHGRTTDMVRQGRRTGQHWEY